MKKLLISTIVLLSLLAIIYSCSKSDETEANAIDTDEYYVDSTGKYVIELGDEGYNIYENGKSYESVTATNRKANATNEILKKYNYNYKGICIMPPFWPRENNNPPLSSLPNKQPTPSKKTITCNFETLGGGYRVTPKPAFLGGSKYSCYECLVSGIDRNDYYLGLCNGNIFISGALVDDPSFQNIKNTLSEVNFNPNQTEEFVKVLVDTGYYNCTKRN
jgi:hypothetical protein